MYIKGRVFIFCSLFWTATYPTQWHDTLHSLFKGVCSELSENVTQITNPFCLFLYISDIKLVHFCCWNCDISHVTDAQMLSKNVIPVDSSRSYEVVRTEKCSKIHSSVTFFSTNVQLPFDPISQQHLSMWTWLRWPAEVHIEHQNIEESCFKMLPYSRGFSQQVAPYVLSWQISFLCQISPKGFLSLPRIKRRICYSGEFVNHYTTEPPTSEQVALNVAYLLEPDVTRIVFKWTSVSFTENGWKMRKYQVSSSSIDENAFLLPHARDKWSDWKRAVIQNHSLESTKVCMKAPLTVQQTTYWSRWDTTAAQKVCYRATLLPSVAQSTLEFNWERETEATIPTKIGPQRTNIAWSDEFRFLLLHSRGRVTIWCKQHERMNAWIHPDLYQHSGVEDSFLAYFGPLGNNQASFKCLHEYCCWPWPWLWRMLFGFLFLSNLKTTCTCSQYNLFELYSFHLFLKLRVVREGAGAYPRIS